MTEDNTILDFSLSELGLVDALPETSFDNLAQLASRMLNSPVSLVSIVDFANDRQYFKAQVGLTGDHAQTRQTPMSHSFCRHVVDRNAALVVPDAREHHLVRDNPAIRDLGVVAYLGEPVYGPAGAPIGAMCVISGAPRAWSASDQENLRMIARFATDMVSLRASQMTSRYLLQEHQEFTTVLSHDLKSPTNTVKLLLSEIAEELGPDKNAQVGQLLALCDATIDRMLSLIEEVLRYVRLVDGHAAHQPVDLNEVARGVIEDLRAIIGASEATVTVSTLPVVRGNAVQLQVLLQNLLSNAIKFVAPGVKPHVRLDYTVRNADGAVAIRVRDNGIGIAPANIDRIFKMFQRLHLRGEYPGSGIGLALCNRIAKNHRGSLEVSSAPGEGSEFVFTMPGKRHG